MNLNQVSEENFSHGRAHGTAYFVKDTKYKGGVLLIHGIFGNRYGMESIATILAQKGYFCLSLDLPGHFLNFGKLTIGESSELVRDGVLALKLKFGQKRVALVAHSLGAIATLYSIAGYNMEMEARIPKSFDRISQTLNLEAELAYKSRLGLKEIEYYNKIIEEEYTQVKSLIFNSLKQNIQSGVDVDCSVFIAPPRSVKAALPAVGLLRRLNHSTTKSLIKTAKPITKGPPEEELKRAGSSLNEFYDVKSAYWGAFRVEDAPEFLNYMLNVYEHQDFLSVVERIAQARKKDNKISFMEYYLKNYIYLKPKLFLYGNTDHLLRTFLGNRRSLERYYTSCGNATLRYGKYNHLMKKNVFKLVGKVAEGNEREIQQIVDFLDRNMSFSMFALKTPYKPA